MGRYYDGIKRLSIAFKPLKEKYGKPTVYFWLNSLIANIVYGVTPNQYIGYRFYEKSRMERKMFYTARHQPYFERKLNDPKFSDMFCDKQKFNEKFSEFIQRDWIYCREATDTEIQEFLSSHQKIIVKPTSLSSGRGIHVYKDDSIESLKKSDTLLEEFVVQHHAMSSLNPTSVNTVRVYSIVDKQNVPHILSASIRVGGLNSEVDNFHSGGVGYPLDVETGVVVGRGRSISGNDYIYHPGTNAKVIGFEVPNWQELVKYIFEATHVIPLARMIAWDVAVLEDGFEMIEGNYLGDPGFMQTPSNTGKLKEIKKYM